jgi:transcriptional regulator with XRE-family HTH domain
MFLTLAQGCLYNTFEINAEVQMERIRQLRKERGLSQAKLAVMADMDPATLNRLERGTGNPNLKTLERVAGALGVEVTDLFPKAQAPLPLEPEAPGLANTDPSAKLAAAAVLEEIAGLWAEQLAQGFYNRRTLGQMRMAGFSLAMTHEAAARKVRETLPPRFLEQLETAEEQFAAVGAQIWEAREALEKTGRGYPLPPDELAPRREAKREELLQKLRGGGQAQHA